MSNNNIEWVKFIDEDKAPKLDFSNLPKELIDWVKTIDQSGYLYTTYTQYIISGEKQPSPQEADSLIIMLAPLVGIHDDVWAIMTGLTEFSSKVGLSLYHQLVNLDMMRQ